jgi:hypothetical protein
MPNVFDQFDAPTQPRASAQANVFDQFDEQPVATQAAPVPQPAEPLPDISTIPVEAREDIGEIRAYEPRAMDRFSRATQPLNELMGKLAAPPPGLHIPQIPDIDKLQPGLDPSRSPNVQPGNLFLGMAPTPSNATGPLSVATGVVNAATEVIPSLMSPVGVATVVHKVPSYITQLLLKPGMAVNTIDQVNKLAAMWDDPSITMAEKTKAITSLVLSAGATAAPLIGSSGKYAEDVRAAADMGLRGPRRKMQAAGRIINEARAAGFRGKTAVDLERWIAERVNAAVAAARRVGDAEMPPIQRQLLDRTAEKTPEQALKTFREEAKLTEDPTQKAKLVDIADNLERQIMEADNAKAAADDMLAAQKEQQKIAEEQAAVQAKDQAVQQLPASLQGLNPEGQLAVLEDVYKKHKANLSTEEVAQYQQLKQGLEQQIEATKQAQQAIDAQNDLGKRQAQLAQEAAQPLIQPKAINLANASAQLAKNMEDQPAAAQSVLNRGQPSTRPAPLAEPAPVAQPGMPEPAAANAPAAQSESLPDALRNAEVNPDGPVGEPAPVAKSTPAEPSAAPTAPKPTKRLTLKQAEKQLAKIDEGKLEYLREQLAAKELSKQDYEQRVRESLNVTTVGGGEVVSSMSEYTVGKVEPKRAEAKPKVRGAANTGRILRMMGDKLYSADTSKTTGKELWQNSADAVMRNPDDSPRRVFIGADSASREFLMADTGPGMTPDIIIDKFLPAGVSGKEVGAAGGLGLAKLAILGGNEAWTVTTVAVDPTGRKVKTVLNGSGMAYHEYAEGGPPAGLQLTPDTDIELGDGITMRYSYGDVGPETPTGTSVVVKTKDPWSAQEFAKRSAKYLPDIEVYDYSHKVDSSSNKDPLEMAGWQYSLDERVQPADMGVFDSVETPFATIDFLADKDPKTQNVQYVNYDVLNRGILQFRGEMALRDVAPLPSGFSVNIKPKVLAEDAAYPFNTSRESVTTETQGIIEGYIKKLADKHREAMLARYKDSLNSAVKMELNKGLVFLDAAGTAPREVLERVSSDPIVSEVTRELAEIQNRILKMLAYKYPDSGYGRASFAGLLTGGNAYGVHFGKQYSSEPSKIYHDIFLTWDDARADAERFLSKDYPQDPQIVDQLLPEATYRFWRNKTAGIALHEGAHQITPSEGEPLSRELTFRAGDAIEALADTPHRKRTQEQYEQIHNTIDSFGKELALSRRAEDAGNFIVSQGGYNGYAFSRTEPTSEGAGQAGGAGGPQPPEGAGSGVGGQAGSIDPTILSHAGSSAAGFLSGYISAEKEKDETEEEFQARRLSRALVLAAGGFMVSHATNNIIKNRGAIGRSKTVRQMHEEALGLEGMPNWYLDLRKANFRLPVIGNVSMQGIRTHLVSSRARIKDMVAETVRLGYNDPMEGANPYLAGKLFPGALAAAVRRGGKVVEETEKKLVSTALASGMDPVLFAANLNLWMELKHTPYYNAMLASRAEPGTVPGGHRFTDADALAGLRALDVNGMGAVYEDLAKDFYKITRMTREIMRDGGLISDETMKEWEKIMPYYVPFRRNMPDDINGIAALSNLGGGPGLNIRSSGVYRISDAGSDLDVSDVTANIYANLNDAIVRAQKNKVQQELVRFVEDQVYQGSPRFLTQFRAGGLGRPVTSVGPDIQVVTPNRVSKFDESRMVSVMFNGRPKWVVFRDPLVAKAASNLNADQLPRWARIVGAPARVLSGLYTKYSLNFLLNNPIRDRGEVAFKLASQGDLKGALGQLNPKDAAASLRAPWDWHMGNNTPEAREFQDFLDLGGMTDVARSMNREGVIGEINSGRHRGQSVLLGGTESIKRFVDLLTELSEGSTRYGVYERALRYGATPQEAALAARNSSIDFGQKGTMAPTMNAMYAFWNPGVQAPVNVAKSIIRNPGALSAAALAFTGLIVLSDIINSSTDPDWKKNKAMAVKRSIGVPFIYGQDPKTGEYTTVTIPVPYGLRAIKGSVDLSIDYGNGELSGEHGKQEFGRFGGMLMDSFNPLGTINLSSAALPTATKPLMDIWTNEAFSGRPIVPTWMHSDPNLPDSAKRFANSRANFLGNMSVKFADQLSDAGIEISPDRMRYLVSSYAGGPGRLLGDTINSLAAPPSGAETRASDVPGMSAFFGRASTEGKEYQTDDYIDAKAAMIKAKGVVSKVGTDAAFFYNQNLKDKSLKEQVEAVRGAIEKGEAPRDPVFIRNIVNRILEDTKGREPTEKVIAEIPNDYDMRAEFIYSRYVKMPKEEGNKMLLELAERGVINDDTVAGLARVMAPK